MFRSTFCMHSYCIYIMASKDNGVLYIGSTNDLLRRVYEHKMHLVKGFTDKFNVTKLVYFEQTDDINQAGEREKKLKNRHRAYKDKLIERLNTDWRDPSRDLWQT